ncbi:MAG: 50S ribosomal protein L11 methyltransferase [Bacteroidales bacterium]|nr:50S ribosomal protein L11 methyltransferase [Bacteroidales bacterium]
MTTLEINIELPIINDNIDEILVAVLSEIGFEGFFNDETMLKAYIEENAFNKDQFEQLLFQFLPNAHYSIATLPNKNWNEQWEKTYEPVIIDKRCIIKAPFHQIEKKYPLEIIINPKMAFGTGHHQTTQLIIERLFEINLKNKKVIDAGCGSGILSIAAEKLGASQIWAFDIDEWSVINTIENIELNKCKNIIVKKGTINDIKPQPAHIILANINRNILLNEMTHYNKCLDPDGLLIISGFIKPDVDILLQKAQQEGFINIDSYHKNEWFCLALKKL